jgi:hypothetical protein
MAYATEGNAGFRHTGWSFGATSILGKIRLLIEKIILREPIMADANNVAISRPVDEVDSRVTAEFLDNAGAISEDTAAANLTSTFSEANGSGTGGVVIGKVAASSVTHTQGRKQGGFNVAQIFEQVGAQTYTPTA